MRKKKIKTLKNKTKFKGQHFLPGFRDNYMFFKKIAKTKGLSPEAAIYSISEQGDAFYYDIIEPSTLEKIFGTRIRNGKKKMR